MKLISLLVLLWNFTLFGLAVDDDLAPCTDPTACNYNVEGECEYTSCAGCMSELACNYDEDATKDDGSCLFVGTSSCAECDWSAAGIPNPKDGTGQLNLNDSDEDGICDDLDNCSNTDACNYDDSSNEACVLKVNYYHDEDGDGIGEYLLGAYCSGTQPGNSTTDAGPDNCTNILKCNYNDAANGACEEDADDDGLCDGSDLCTDHTAPNYDHVESGNVACCDDDNNNGVCDDREVFGCMDSHACNYLSIANIDDGSCKFTGTTTSNSGNSTSQYQVSAEDFQCDECLANGDTVTIAESVRAALGLSGTTFYIGEYVGNDADGDEICDAAEQVGCNDVNACNYAMDVNGDSYSQAVDAYGNLATDADGNAVYITESCYFDEDLGYGVTPQEEQCDNYCKYLDACSQCGGTGVDADNDGICDDGTDLCTNPLACNYTANPTEACKFLTECGVCATGVDSDNDGYIDGSDDDTDDDGICDTSDNCYDLNACNYSDSSNEVCKYLTECGVCSTGTDSDNDGYIDGNDDDSDDDGLCDNDDNCTDTSACNYDYRLYPGNSACFDDDDSDGVCNIHEVVGCQDSAACNYNDEATDNDASLCVFADGDCEVCAGSGTDGSGYVVLQDSDGDGVCDGVDLCSDVTACNYDDSANEACGEDSDDNGTCDDAEVEGCKNATACNYNSSATRDNGSCVFATNCEVCSGATDGTGTVVAQDSDFDGVCDGSDNCSDVAACNYIAASSLNASCEYATAGYNCQGDCLTDADNDGICEYNGADNCSDLTACNYDDPSNPSCLYYNSCGECIASTLGELGYDPTVYCDCDLNVYDVMGYCGGACLEDVDNDGICDIVDPCLTPGETPDECGVCGGPGAIYECGCFELPEEGCSCEPDGTVTYPVLGEDCDGNCLYGFTIVDGVVVCNYFDNAEITEVVDPIHRFSIDSEAVLEIGYHQLQDWVRQIDTLHQRMSDNLDDGSLTGASKRLTIEEEILDKGKLTVAGNTKLAGLVQMDSNVVIVGNLVVEQNLTVKGTTFSRGGIETSSMNMSGDLAVGGATVLDSTLEVRNNTLLHDSLTLLAPLIVGSDHVFTVDNAGNTHINGKVTIMDSLIATSNGTRLGDLVARGTTVTTLNAKGSATFNSTVNVHGDSELDGNLDVGGNASVSGTLEVDGSTTLTSLSSSSISNSGELSSNSIENQTSLSTSSLTVRNSANIQTLEVTSSAEVTGVMSVKSENDSLLFGVTPGANNGALGLVSLPGDLKIYATSTAYAQTPASPEISLGSTGAISATGKLTSKNLETTSTSDLSTFAGPLRVDKSTRLLDGLTVEVAGDTALYVRRQNGSIELNNSTTINNDLTVSGGRTVTIGNTSSNSSLVLNGAATLKSLTVNTSSTFTGTLSGASGAFTSSLSTGGVARAEQGLIVGDGTQEAMSVPSGYTALFDGSTNGMGTSNGIKIRVNQGTGQVSNSNEFITFENNSNQLVGRISGQNSTDWNSDAFLAADQSSHQGAAWAGRAEATVRLAIMTKNYLAYAAHVGESLSELIPDSWCCSFLLPIGCIIIPVPGIPLPDFAEIPTKFYVQRWKLAEAITSKQEYLLALAGMIQKETFLALWNSHLDSDLGDYGGISYASGNGDYAEYIPKLNRKDEFAPRQIVGIKDGKLSLSTQDVDHYMVVSTAPIVVGNQPLDQVESDYEVVAFMGQVPVDVLGPVSAGDYILPSGDNDGYGIAMHPEEINPTQLEQIVGVAWENGRDRHFNTVNIAVGLEHRAEEIELNKVKTEADALEAQMRELRSVLETQHMDVPSQLTAFEFNQLSTPRPEKGNFIAQSKPVIGMEQSTGQDNVVGDVFSAVDAPLPADDHMALETSEQQSEQDMFYSEYGNYLSSVLSPHASFEDLQSLASVYNSQLGTTQIPLVNAASNEFVDKMIALEFSNEAIQSMIRSDILGNQDFPAFKNIRPGTQAERKLIQQFQEGIANMVQEERVSRQSAQLK